MGRTYLPQYCVDFFKNARTILKANLKQTKNSKRKTKTDATPGCQLSLGLRVLGCWPDDKVSGEWFEGKVKGIDYEEQTVHIRYEDGDIDDAVPWSKCHILGDSKD